MKLTRSALAMGLLMVHAIAGAQSHVHQHGTLTFQIGIDANNVTIQIASPLENIVGFEHAPRTDAERKRVNAALTRLSAAQELIALDPAAQCRVANSKITAAVLGLDVLSTVDPTDRHADLSVTLDFECRDTTKATYVDARLFDAFADIKRIDVQVAGPRGQFKLALRRPQRRIPLTR